MCASVDVPGATQGAWVHSRHTVRAHSALPMRRLLKQPLTLRRKRGSALWAPPVVPAVRRHGVRLCRGVCGRPRRGRAASPARHRTGPVAPRRLPFYTHWPLCAIAHQPQTSPTENFLTLNFQPLAGPWVQWSMGHSGSWRKFLKIVRANPKGTPCKEAKRQRGCVHIHRPSLVERALFIPIL